MTGYLICSYAGIPMNSSTLKQRIIPKQYGIILLITRNHCVIIIRQNVKLPPTPSPRQSCIIQFAVIDESIKLA